MQDNLEINGYYTSKTSNFEEKQNNIYFFYRNGITLYGGTISAGKDTDEYVRSLSEPLNIKGLQADVSGWGVFHVEGSNIKFEIWSPGGPPIKTIIYDGTIIDSSKFVMTSFYNGYTNKTSLRNDTFRFKEFSPKPDSTNRYIK